jgi:Iron-containing alcohol dehydrogenase
MSTCDHKCPENLKLGTTLPNSGFQVAFVLLIMAVETLYAPGLHPINDVLALEAIRKLFSYLPQSKAHTDDLAVRTELQLAAWMSFFNPASIQKVEPLSRDHSFSGINCI